MSAWQLLSELDRRGISIWADGGDLRFRAPKGALTPQLRSRLKDGKNEILSLLRQETDTNAPQLPSLRPAPEKLHEPFPLTDLQQAYWVGFSDVFELGNVAPHAYIEFDLEGIDLEGLERAWQTLIERHGMLRAVLLPEGRQQILEVVPPYQIRQQDLRQADAETAQRQMLEARQQMCRKGPALYQWPLFELRAFRLGDERFRLLWSLSLLICDDWSFHVLCQEWFRAYRQPDADMPTLQISFRDCVQALKDFEQSPAYRRSLEYWRQRAVDLPAAPQLPLACEPGQIGVPEFERRSRSIEWRTWRKFKQHARQAGVTPSAALLAAYSEVLATWSKQRRFTLNLLFFNRPPLHPQVEQLVGNFSSTLLLEADCSGRLPFAERARRLQRELWSNLEHSRVSGVRVLREMGKAREGDSRAAVPVVFASNLNTGLNQSDGDQTPSESAAVRSVYSHLQTSHVWLDHQAFEINGALQFNWDAVRGLFPEGFAEQTYNAYCRLLDRLIEQDEAWQQPVGCLTPKQDLKLWDQVNATQNTFPEALLHELFERQVKQRPDRTAILDSRCTLTYRQVAMRTRQLGKELRRRGARPNDLVAVVLSKGWEQAVAVLAVLNAGAAYLPVSPSLPAERFRYLLENSGVELALTRSEQGPGPWPSGVSCLTVDRPAPSEPISPLQPVQKKEDLAYVIYTSGTTGLPKGVMIDHRGAVNTVLDVNSRFSMGPSDRVLALSALNFDLSVYDIFGVLAAGGAVVFPDRQQLLEPSHWADLLTDHGITLWNTVPALMQMLVEYLEGESETLRDNLRLVMLSGDWIPVGLPDRIQQLGSEVKVVSLGGATEASIWSILYPIGEVDHDWPSIPYGKPMGNQTFHVLDDDLQPRPAWVTGELYIGGTGVALGYLGDEEKTRRSFIVHPRTGRRIYRTGDLGRYLPDGNIQFLGREDTQVKVQGHRIELGEIEAALNQHPAVSQAVAAALGEGAGRRLVAYVVGRRGGEEGKNRRERGKGTQRAAEKPSQRPLRLPSAPSAVSPPLPLFLTQHLPDYMIPATFVALDSLPLTPNGKVDRSALPGPEEAAAGIEEASIAPRTAVERRLAEIWEELLEVDSIGVRDDFFDRGGNSLLVVQLMARIRPLYGRSLPLSTLLEAPTIEHLAQVLESKQADSPLSALVKLADGGAASPLFCVHPSGGNVLCYRRLARLLSPKIPFYGLQTPALDGRSPLIATMEEMASSYLVAVRSVQPQGPYRLAGWSMGGVAAFEMACQLQEQGQRVEFLGVLDALAPRPDPVDDSPGDRELLAWFERDLSELAGKSPLPDESQQKQLFEIFKTNFRAMLSYRLRCRFPARLTLIKARQGIGREGSDPALGWGEAADEVTVHEIEGDHYAAVRPPGVQETANVLLKELRAKTPRRQEPSPF